MTLTEWVALGQAALTVVAMVGAAVYARGGKDAETKTLQSDLKTVVGRVDNLEHEVAGGERAQGRQDVRNKQIDDLITEMREWRDEVIKFSTRVEGHERECAAGRKAVDARFDKIDREIEGWKAELRNVALGESNVVRELPATIGRHRRGR